MAKEINFNSLESVLSGLFNLLRIDTGGVPTTVPAPLILAGAGARGGLSATKVANRIISRRGEAGLPVGALPNGDVSNEERLERIRVEEILKAIQEDANIQVVIPPGQSLTGVGGNAGGPVTIVGSTTFYTRGNAVIT